MRVTDSEQPVPPRAAKSLMTLQLAVFGLVAASFTNIYLTQPILPVLQEEFGVTTVGVSTTVSAVIFGIMLSNLFFGVLSDRFPIKPILATGGLVVAGAGLYAASTHDFSQLVTARLVQGLFLPALTTSIAAWLARNLPVERLSVVMGSYVSATVLGGLGGRLLGGFIHPPLHWRYAFITAALLILVATCGALLLLPRDVRHTAKRPRPDSFIHLVRRRELLRLFCCGAGGFLMFTPLFNFLPYRLAAPPFSFSTELITMIYLVYVLGIFTGPMAGRMSNRFGGGNTLLIGTGLFFGALLLLVLPSVTAVVLGLLLVCAGFFTIHAVAVGLINGKLTGSHGRANALYVLFYYLGGWLGITGGGFAYQAGGWWGVILFVSCFLPVPLVTGLTERRRARIPVDGDTA